MLKNNTAIRRVVYDKSKASKLNQEPCHGQWKESGKGIQNKLSGKEVSL